MPFNLLVHEYGSWLAGTGAVLTGVFFVLKNRDFFKRFKKKKEIKTVGGCPDGGCRAEWETEIFHLQKDMEKKVSEEKHNLEIRFISVQLTDGKKRFGKLDTKVDDINTVLADIKKDMAVLIARKG